MLATVPAGVSAQEAAHRDIDPATLPMATQEGRPMASVAPAATATAQMLPGDSSATRPSRTPLLPSASDAPGSSGGPVAGDGRVHAPAPIEVGYSEFRPNEVQTLVVHPLSATVLRFNYPVERAIFGDPVTFTADAYGTSLTILTKDCFQGCRTNLLVWLKDGLGTIAPYNIVVDTTKTVSMVRNFTDPVANLIQRRDSQWTAQVEAEAQRAVGERLAAEVEKCVVAGFTFAPSGVANAWRDKNTGESMSLRVDDVGFSGRCLAKPRLYIRYVLANARYAPLTDIALHVARYARDLKQPAPLRVADDRRTPATLPPLKQVRGTLVVEDDGSLRPGDELQLTAVLDGHIVPLGTILTIGGKAR